MFFPPFVSSFSPTSPPRPLLSLFHSFLSKNLNQKKKRKEMCDNKTKMTVFPPQQNRMFFFTHSSSIKGAPLCGRKKVVSEVQWLFFDMQKTSNNKKSVLKREEGR